MIAIDVPADRRRQTRCTALAWQRYILLHIRDLHELSLPPCPSLPATRPDGRFLTADLSLYACVLLHTAARSQAPQNKQRHAPS